MLDCHQRPLYMMSFRHTKRRQTTFNDDVCNFLTGKSDVGSNKAGAQFPNNKQNRLRDLFISPNSLTSFLRALQGVVMQFVFCLAH